MTELSVGDGGNGLRDRLLDAALALAATQGVTKTTMAGLAQVAGCSRATAYRAFGSKGELFEAASHRELSRFSDRLGSQLATAATFEDALTFAVVEAHDALTGHAALQFVLAREPGVVLPFLGFGRVDQLYATVRALGGPHFARFVGPEPAGWVAEWISRLVLSHLFMPRPDLNLADHHHARALVRQFVVPAFVAGMSPRHAGALAPAPAPVLFPSHQPAHSDALALSGAPASTVTQGS